MKKISISALNAPVLCFVASVSAFTEKNYIYAIFWFLITIPFYFMVAHEDKKHEDK